MLMEASGVKVPVKLTLTKNIPAGTGLGSASSDAAATLIGLNTFLKTGIEDKSLSRMAAALGSDVAFFLGVRWRFVPKRRKIQKLIKMDFCFIDASCHKLSTKRFMKITATIMTYKGLN
jgi:hypothetical protein